MNMKRFNEFKCLLILSILCYLTRPVLSGCQDATFVEGVDYFPDKVYFDDNGRNNPDFSVTYHNNYIILTNINTSETYVLYCTAAQPNVATNASKYIQIPVANVAVSDRTIISFLEILGEETSLKYVDDKSKITSPCLQKYSSLYENMNFANTTQVASIDVIFTNTPSQAGGNYVTISYDEDTPALKKAQWIKYISLFFNKTAAANEAFDKIQSNYLCHVDNLSKIPNQTKKTIAWVSLESDNTFTIKYSAFYPNITFDSGAFILNPQTASELTTDSFHQNIKDAYIVIDMSNLIAPNNTLDAWKHYFGYDQVSDLPRFLKEKRLFRTHKLLNNNGYDAWTEESASRPDLILQDLIAIQYPLYQKDYVVNWFDKFAETGDNVVISVDKCDVFTFGLPKTDFGTCAPTKFLGDGKDNNGTQIINIGEAAGNKPNNSNNNNDKKKNRKVKRGVIIAVASIGTLVTLGLGAWLFVVARKKYRERFVKLRDEPVVQMNSVEVK